MADRLLKCRAGGGSGVYHREKKELKKLQGSVYMDSDYYQNKNSDSGKKDSGKKHCHKASGIILLFVFADVLCVVLAYFIALWARFDFLISKVPTDYVTKTLRYECVIVIASVIIYSWLRLYKSVWRYVSVNEAVVIIKAHFLLGIVNIILEFIPFFTIPRSVAFIGFVLNFFGCFIIRFFYRGVRFFLRNWDLRNSDERDGHVKNVMVIGAGKAARELLKEMSFSRRNELRVQVIVDDNQNIWGSYLEGVVIGGGREQIPSLVNEYDIDLIIFAIPGCLPEERRAILNICNETGVKTKAIPDMMQIVDGKVSLSRLRDVDVTDLLGRNEININVENVLSHISGRVVMVTGGGGSIGSELCRQIARNNPKQLIIFDIYENNAYAIQQELKREYGDKLNLVTLIGSVRNTNRVNWVLKKYKPEIIYHAAAHKHVPLMEESPNEAIKNNTIGTYKLAHAAWKNGVKSFLLISTDKAVNPTNIMGASKRLCEMVIQMMSRAHPETKFSAVRFGNVLGSNGSVIPLFKKQITEGGPVTVTDPNIIRYFMTIPEAVSLVLQASYYAKGGEIFVLDMGEPVKIDDMARNLIRLSGYIPDVDIKIEYTGLRPGEKLFEEVLMDEEGMQKTENKLIYIGHPIQMDDELFRKQLKRLDKASKSESPEIKKIVAEVVKTYHPDLSC